jgi:Na+/citrate or Na+/malate symporter
VGAGVVGGGVTVVGVAVGDSEQVQVGEAVGVDVYEIVAVGVGAGVSPLGDVDASAECETNRTVKLVTASAVLANPAIFARFVIFTAVTRCLLGCDKNRARGQ